MQIDFFLIKGPHPQFHSYETVPSITRYSTYARLQFRLGDRQHIKNRFRKRQKKKQNQHRTHFHSHMPPHLDHQALKAQLVVQPAGSLVA
jgi:hypothetical protein